MRGTAYGSRDSGVLILGYGVLENTGGASCLLGRGGLVVSPPTAGSASEGCKVLVSREGKPFLGYRNSLKSLAFCHDV